MIEAVHLAGFLIAVLLAGIRWLRTAQREHYHVGRVSIFALRWWQSSVPNLALFGVALVAAIAATRGAGAVAVAAASLSYAATAIAPLGLPFRGRSAPLRWTRRMYTVALLAAVLVCGIMVAAALTRTARLLPLAALLTPLLLDAALAVDSGIERLLTSRYVHQARRKLQRVRPMVVGVTGSYGKTTVKVYAAHLLGLTKTTLASRASYNNRLGLALSINQDLGMGTEVFVAEMGTYGPGEIRELCGWLGPSIGVITAIGPVHLERMGSIANIVAAKSEILESADTAVINADVPELRDLAVRIRSRGRRVIECSSRAGHGDVEVRRTGDMLRVRVGDEADDVPLPSASIVPVNAALALGICLAADAVPPSLPEALRGLPVVANRLTVHRSNGKPTVIDDTYNSNPAGARHALDLLTQIADADGANMTVVTPGMVELGRCQASENRAFAQEVARIGSALVVVGRTNRAALVDGYRGVAGEAPVTVAHRDEAVSWIRREKGSQDHVVLYENDLPDHYP